MHHQGRYTMSCKKSDRLNRSSFICKSILLLLLAYFFTFLINFISREYSRSISPLLLPFVKYIRVSIAPTFALPLFKAILSRLHDINFSGWHLIGYYFIVASILEALSITDDIIWYFIILLPLFILMIKPSYPYSNKWGDPPEE